MTDTQWVRNLQRFIYNTLSHIIPNPQERSQYVTEAAMPIWVKAFTHETVSFVYNYEDLEYIGDSVLDLVFLKYCLKRFPNYHKNHYTELNTAYNSKMKQGEFSRRLGFSNYIRLGGGMTVPLNIETDVFESFFGALYTVSDNIVEGLGVINCYNMIIYVYQNVDIDVNVIKGSPKTQVQQIFKRFELGDVIQDFIKGNDGVNTFTVTITDKQDQFLRNYNINLPSRVIGKASQFNITKTDADNKAYINALETLAQYGIDTDWAVQAKHEFDLMNSDISVHLPAVRNRLQREGYINFRFYIPRKLTDKNNNSVVELLGMREDGNEEILALKLTNDKKNSYASAKASLIKDYAQESESR